MAWMELLDVNQQGFNNYINTLMQIQENKAQRYNAGLENQKQLIMNDKNYDPGAEQGVIDAFLYDKFGVRTKDTKAVQLNEMMNKIDKMQYGSDYADIYGSGNSPRSEFVTNLLGEYNPNRPQQIDAQRRAKAAAKLEKNRQIAAQKQVKNEAKVERAKQSGKFEAPSEDFLKTIQAQNRRNFDVK